MKVALDSIKARILSRDLPKCVRSAFAAGGTGTFLSGVVSKPIAVSKVLRQWPEFLR